MTDSGVDATKSGDYLKATFEFAVVGGDFAGRKVWDQLNIQGLTRKANPDAVRIGKERLKTIATIGGHRNPNFIKDTEELHGFIVGARLTIEDDYNRVKSYKKPSAAVAGRAAQPPAQTAQDQASVPPEVADQATRQGNGGTKPKRPWEK